MRASILTVVLVSACGMPSVTSDAGELPQMIALAKSKSYRAWSREPAPHTSTGPHGGTVRTFANDTLYDALRGGATELPIGSIVLKELHSGDAITGYAIDWKGDDGQWRFFEGFEPSLNQFFFTGTDNGCAGCHRPGIDYLLTTPSAFVDGGVP